MRSGIPPWHMWGNTQIIENDAGSVSDQTSPGQILRISYLRPETWNFILAAKPIEVPDQSGFPPGTQCFIALQWHITIGVGRSITRMTTFENFQWQWTTPGGPPLVQIRVSEAMQSVNRTVGNPVLDPTNIRATTPSFIRDLVAQDIQLEVLMNYFTNPIPAGAGTRCKLEVDAMFAPKSHIRPEWFKGGRFPGAEDGGSETSTVADQVKKLAEEKATPGSDADPRDQGGSFDERQAEWQAYVDSLTEEQYQALLRERYSDQVAEISAEPPVPRLHHNHHHRNPRRLG